MCRGLLDGGSREVLGLVCEVPTAAVARNSARAAYWVSEAQCACGSAFSKDESDVAVILLRYGPDLVTLPCGLRNGGKSAFGDVEPTTWVE